MWELVLAILQASFPWKILKISAQQKLEPNRMYVVCMFSCSPAAAEAPFSWSAAAPAPNTKQASSMSNGWSLLKYRMTSGVTSLLLCSWRSCFKTRRFLLLCQNRRCAASSKIQRAATTKRNQNGVAALMSMAPPPPSILILSGLYGMCLKEPQWCPSPANIGRSSKQHAANIEMGFKMLCYSRPHFAPLQQKMSYYFERTSKALVGSHLYSNKNEAIYFILASPLSSDFFWYRPTGWE